MDEIIKEIKKIELSKNRIIETLQAKLKIRKLNKEIKEIDSAQRQIHTKLEIIQKKRNKERKSLFRIFKKNKHNTILKNYENEIDCILEEGKSNMQRKFAIKQNINEIRKNKRFIKKIEKRYSKIKHEMKSGELNKTIKKIIKKIDLGENQLKELTKNYEINVKKVNKILVELNDNFKKILVEINKSKLLVKEFNKLQKKHALQVKQLTKLPFNQIGDKKTYIEINKKIIKHSKLLEQLVIEGKSCSHDEKYEKLPIWNKKYRKITSELSEIIKQIKKELKKNTENKYQKKQYQKRKTESNKIISNEKLKKYFLILEIDDSTPFEGVKKAYRELIKFYHPDKFQQIPSSLKRAETKTREIKEAYEQLKKNMN